LALQIRFLLMVSFGTATKDYRRVHHGGIPGPRRTSSNFGEHLF
jgi:hypothetical protein